MKKQLIATLLSGFILTVNAEEMTSTDYAERGMRYADEFPGLASLCDLSKPLRDMGAKNKTKAKTKPKDNSKQTSKKRRSTPIPPTQVFDNLYYVGTGGVASWVLQTSEGLIVIDALNNNEQAQNYIEKGLLEFGLNPNDINYLIIMHEHGDHYGGQAYLKQKYQAKIVMSDKAWTILEQPQQDFSSPRWGEKPSRDVSVNDGDSIQLGDTAVQIYETPGHTPGTISLIFPVYDNGQKHMVSLWGGTGLNFGEKQQRIFNYSESAKRFQGITKSAGVDIFISNHPTRDGSAERLKMLANRTDEQPHPFVIRQTQASHAFDLLSDCTYAQALKISEKEGS